MNNILFALLILILLLSAVLADYTFQGNLAYSKEQLESIPTMVFLYGEKELSEVEALLSDNHIVASVKIERNVEILRSMIRSYNLGDVEDIIDSSLLPHIIEISYESNSFDYDDFSALIDKIQSLVGNDGVVFGSDEMILEIYDNINRNQLIKRLFIYGIGISLLITVFFADREYLYRTNNYWKVYTEAGGIKKRAGQYLQVTLMRAIIPVIIVVSVIIAFAKYGSLDYYLDMRQPIIAIGLIIIADLWVWLIYRED